MLGAFIAFYLKDVIDRQHYILVLLRRMDISVNDLSTENTVARSLAAAVIASQQASPRIQEAIADRIGTNVDILWPAGVEECPDMV